MTLGPLNVDKFRRFKAILYLATYSKGYCTYVELQRALVVGRFTEDEARRLASKWMGALMYVKNQSRSAGNLREETLRCMESVFYGGLAPSDKRGTAEPVRQLAACFRDKVLAATV